MPTTTKADRRAEQARIIAENRARLAKTERRRRLMWVSVNLTVLVIFTVVAAVILAASRDSQVPSAGQIRPPYATDTTGVVTDADGVVTPPADASDTWPQAADGPVVVSVYSDPMCPWCGVFAQTAMPVLAELAEAGDVVIDHHLVTTLDEYSAGTRYSTRAVNALYTVADLAPDTYTDFETALFAAQPEENTPGLSDDQIAAVARTAGVPPAVVDTFADGTYTWWAGQVTNAAYDRFDGKLATPAVLINGVPLDGDVDWRDPDSLKEAIAAARD